MPRRAEIQARTAPADSVYGSQLVTQVINKVMLDGKKSIAEDIVYGALETVATKTGRPPDRLRRPRSTPTSRRRQALSAADAAIKRWLTEAGRL